MDRRAARDGIVAAGQAEEKGTLHADNVDVEDSQPQQTMTTPELPPRAIVEGHMIYHCPPRSWCNECNEGRGRERRHGRVSELNRVAIVSTNYAFMTRKGHCIRG